MKKKIIWGIVAAAVFSMLAGCGQKQKEKEEEPQEQLKLVMATHAEIPPFSYYEEDEIQGTDIEIAKKIAERLDMKLEIVDMDFEDILPAVQSGEADLGIAAISIETDRLKQVAFSEPYHTGYQVILTTQDSSIQSFADLNGKKIGVKKGTTGDSYTTDEFGEKYITRYKSGKKAVEAMRNGEIDAVIIDDQAAAALAEENTFLKILETDYVEENYAIAIQKDQTELLENINQILRQIKEDGNF